MDWINKSDPYQRHLPANWPNDGVNDSVLSPSLPPLPLPLPPFRSNPIASGQSIGASRNEGIETQSNQIPSFFFYVFEFFQLPKTEKKEERNGRKKENRERKKDDFLFGNS